MTSSTTRLGFLYVGFLSAAVCGEEVDEEVGVIEDSADSPANSPDEVAETLAKAGRAAADDSPVSPDLPMPSGDDLLSLDDPALAPGNCRDWDDPDSCYLNTQTCYGIVTVCTYCCYDDEGAWEKAKDTHCGYCAGLPGGWPF